MRTRAVMLGLLTLAAFAPAQIAWAACEGSPGRSGTFTLDVASSTRSFSVRVPSSADGRRPLPVLFAFHPFGMNGQYMLTRVPGRFWPDAITVFPDGFARPGGPSAPSWQTSDRDGDDRDLRFFDAMMAWLGREHCVDRARIFVLGYSNGAGLASLIACRRTEVIAGVALAAGRPACAPPASKPVVIGHGLRDQTVSYQQGMDASAAWSRANGCASPPKAGAPGCFAAQSCSSAPVLFCTHAGGHEYSSTFSRSVTEFFSGLNPAAGK